MADSLNGKQTDRADPEYVKELFDKAQSPGIGHDVLNLQMLRALEGVVIGGGLWWYTLSTLVNIFRKKFRLRVLITINRVSGVLITVLGGLVILAAFEPFRSLLPAA